MTDRGRPWRRVRPTAAERGSTMPGDDWLAGADAVMDRAFSLDAPAAAVWPWFVQLGKGRAGWYLPHGVERLIPRSRRAIRHLDPRWQVLGLGDVIPDYGGKDETFTVHEIAPGSHLVYTSTRGRMNVSWAIALHPIDADRTRVHLRLRLGPIRRRWLVGTLGELVDLLTIAGLAAGLDERL